MRWFFTLFSILLLTLSGYAQWPFTETAALAGVISNHIDPKLIGGGVVIFDYNNDGLEDLYFTAGTMPDKLFRNNGNGLFLDVSDVSGITAGVRPFKTVGAVCGDLDHDGYKDLVITTDIGQPNLVLQNIGGTSFRVLMPFPNDPKSWSTTAVLGDYNKDGYLDVYIFNYVAYSQDPFVKFLTGGLPNVFYQNNGNFQFTDITQSTNTADNGAGTAGTFSDFDNDGDVDLFVINDFGNTFGPNNLLINQYPSQQFSAVVATSPMKATIDGMGIAIGDYNEDGLLDYYVANYQGESNLLLTNTGSDFMEQSLLKNVQDYNDVSWGTFFFDFNNDSYLDLFVANGLYTNPTVPSNNRLFQQDGAGNFADVTATNVIYNNNTFRGAAFGDVNNDGFPDVVVVGVLEAAGGYNPAILLMNQAKGSNNWLKLRMKGTLSNPDAYGTRVQLYFSGRKLIREVDGGSSYLSQNSSVVHFGIGTASQIDSLTIIWPSGLIEKYYNLKANQYLEVVENAKIAPVEIITGITPAENPSQLVIYPNPFNEYIYVTLNSEYSDFPSFILFNTMGQKLTGIKSVEQISSGSFILQMDQSLSAEIYILRIENGGKSLSGKIIKNFR